MSTNDRTAAAQALVAHGVAVFLLHHPVIGGCTCTDGADCTSQGKHPLHTGWQHESTTDPAAIADLWRTQPHANIGVDTEKSHVVVIDSDPRHDGHKTIERLLAELGPLPPTPTVLTSTDRRGIVGRHAYFAAPDEPINSSAGRLGDGVDVKAANGLVVGAGSQHYTGSTYQWAPGLSPDEVPFATLPDVWANALRVAGEQPKAVANAGIGVPGVGILTDSEIIFKLTTTDRDAVKYAALMRGEWSSYFSSQSEADLSLCSRTAFYAAGDADQIERVFGASALAERAKWHKASYRRATIKKAIAGLTGFYTGQAPTPTRADVQVPATDDPLIAGERANIEYDLEAALTRIREQDATIAEQARVIDGQKCLLQIAYAERDAARANEQATLRGVREGGALGKTIVGLAKQATIAYNQGIAPGAPFKTYREDIGKWTGTSDSCVTTHLKRLEKRKALVKPPTYEHRTILDRETGEITYPDELPHKRLVVALGTTERSYAGIITYLLSVPAEASEPKQGGKREPNPKRLCPTCGAFLEPALHAHCPACGHDHGPVEPAAEPVTAAASLSKQNASIEDAAATTPRVYPSLVDAKCVHRAAIRTEALADTPVSPDEAVRILSNRTHLRVITVSGVHCKWHPNRQARYTDTYGETFCEDCAPPEPAWAGAGAAAGGGD